MSLDNLSSQLVVDFWREGNRQFDAEIKDKSDSEFMSAVAVFLDGLGILDKEQFLHNYTTTIFNHVYVPFTLGEPSTKDNLWNQIVIGVHEWTHVQQYHDHPAAFTFRYLLYPNSRAEYEAQAYAADLEMAWWRFKTHGYDVTQRTKSLLNYGLQQKHCSYVAEYLKVHEDIFHQGGGTSPVAAWAKEWLQVNGIRP